MRYTKWMWTSMHLLEAWHESDHLPGLMKQPDPFYESWHRLLNPLVPWLEVFSCEQPYPKIDWGWKSRREQRLTPCRMPVLCQADGWLLTFAAVYKQWLCCSLALESPWPLSTCTSLMGFCESWLHMSPGLLASMSAMRMHVERDVTIPSDLKEK